MNFKVIKYFSVFAFFIILNKVSAQKETSYISHYEQKNQVESLVLEDHFGTKYILNNERNSIKAIDKKDKILWETNPRKDAMIEKYRFDNPKIIFFKFKKSPNNDSEEIWIVYNNTQFGSIDKLTGKFDFKGED